MRLTKRSRTICGLLILGVGFLATTAWLLARGDRTQQLVRCILVCATPASTGLLLPTSQTGSSLAAGAIGSQPDDRFGVIASGDVEHALKLLGVRWWYSFNSSTTVAAGSRVMLIPTRAIHGVVTRDSLAHVQAMARENPGSYWIIGNEPNVPGQDNVTPETYVDEYRYYASAIRGVDPTAKFVGPNVLNFDTTCSGCDGITPGRTWVKRFVAAWSSKTATSLPFDVWGIHVYSITWDTLPMVDAMTAEREIASFSEYVATIRSERAKPIWLTEFGVIWGYPGIESVNNGCGAGSDCLKPTGNFAIQPVTDYLTQLVSWLSGATDRYRVRKWFLYTTYGSPEPYATSYAGISLLNGPGSTDGLTTFGTLYRSLANR